MREDAAETLERLLISLRSGVSTRVALQRWPDQVNERTRSALAPVARRVALGAPPEQALRLLPQGLDDETMPVHVLFALHRATGASLIALLERRTREIRESARARGMAGANAAGARVSARLVAGLPLAFVPLMPWARASVFDRVGSAFLVVGILLCVIGFRWISALIPSAPPDDLAASLAESLRGVLLAGGDARAALNALADSADGDLGAALEPARRKVSLGAGWPRALALSESEELRSLGEVLDRSHRIGAPTAEALREFASMRRSSVQNRFESEVRRAPVVMVLPLTLCVLPAYALLGLAPFIRGMTPG